MPARVAVIVFPGTNSEDETVDACRDAGIDARLFWWSENPRLLRGFDAFVLAGGFAHEDRVRAGAIAAKSAIVAAVKAEAASGKLVLGICNGAQVLAESGMLGDIAIARNLPSGRFQCRYVNVRACAPTERCAFTRGLAADSVYRMVLAHGEGRFCGEARIFDELEATGRIVFRYVGESPNGALRRAAGVCNREGNVLGLMPHPERVAWAFNNVWDGARYRGGDPNRTVGAHAIFSRMAGALERKRGMVW